MYSQKDSSIVEFHAPFVVTQGVLGTPFFERTEVVPARRAKRLWIHGLTLVCSPVIPDGVSTLAMGMVYSGVGDLVDLFGSHAPYYPGTPGMCASVGFMSQMNAAGELVLMQKLGEGNNEYKWEVPRNPDGLYYVTMGCEDLNALQLVKGILVANFEMILDSQKMSELMEKVAKDRYEQASEGNIGGHKTWGVPR